MLHFFLGRPVFKALAVVVETGFELRFTATEVVHGAVIRCQCSFKYDALSFQGAAGFGSAVARWCCVTAVAFSF